MSAAGHNGDMVWGAAAGAWDAGPIEAACPVGPESATLEGANNKDKTSKVLDVLPSPKRSSSFAPVGGAWLGVVPGERRAYSPRDGRRIDQGM